MPNFIDRTGQKFGRWTVISRAPNKGKKVMWNCKCDCGTEKIVCGSSLQEGRSTSCGCYHNELSSKIANIALKGINIKDLVGQKFGELTVIEDSGLRASNGGVIWKCQCSCGKITNKSSSQLKKGKGLHCGCQQIVSLGENRIREILNENNINFEQQKIFDNCRFPKTNQPARFDFYVADKYIIEFDGEFHYPDTMGITPRFTEEKYLYTKEHDEYKNQWCKENNIPIIRIPYTHYKELSINDLLLETSKFLL